MSSSLYRRSLKLALDWAIAGDDAPIPVLERPHVQAALGEPDARRILRDFATNILEVMTRTAALTRVLESAAGLDADLRALNDDLRHQRQQGMSFLAAVLDERGALRQGLTVTEAAGTTSLFGLVTTPPIAPVVVDCANATAQRASTSRPAKENFTIFDILGNSLGNELTSKARQPIGRR